LPKHKESLHKFIDYNNQNNISQQPQNSIISVILVLIIFVMIIILIIVDVIIIIIIFFFFFFLVIQIFFFVFFFFFIFFLYFPFQFFRITIKVMLCRCTFNLNYFMGMWHFINLIGNILFHLIWLNATPRLSLYCNRPTTFVNAMKCWIWDIINLSNINC